MTIRPEAFPPMVMSKKTLGFDIELITEKKSMVTQMKKKIQQDAITKTAKGHRASSREKSAGTAERTGVSQ